VELPQSIAFMLMGRILDLVKESGADHHEAMRALDGAKVFLQELNLEDSPQYDMGPCTMYPAGDPRN
jgi:hypothetical protein